MWLRGLGIGNQFVRTTTTWQPFLQDAYNITARLAILDGDDAKLKATLAKKALNPMSSEFDLLFHDAKVIEDLISSGKANIAAEYIANRAKEHISDPGIAFQLELVKKGKLPFSEEKPEGF